jgi:hypothetical protein
MGNKDREAAKQSKDRREDDKDLLGRVEGDSRRVNKDRRTGE